MATWHDRMGRATFRGVPFFVSTGELEGGRRTVVHEFPLRDTPFAEDLGRKGRGFSIEGHVLGASYLVDRDALLAALETGGPGELVHPYYGARRVAVESFRVRESAADGGIATFSISFAETEAAPEFPRATSSATASVTSAAQGACDAIRVKAVEVGEYNFAATALADLSMLLTDATLAMRTALEPIANTTEDLALLNKALLDIELDATALAGQPEDALDALASMLDAVTFRAGAAVTALIEAHDFVPSTARPSALTPSREEEQIAYDAILLVVRIALAAHAATLAASEAFACYDDAALARDAIADALDADAEYADDTTFAALTELRSALVRAVPGEDSDLPKLVTYTPPATVPSLVLCHRLYGSLDREQDILDRNRIKRPGFILGGAALEVLSDA